MLSDSQERIIFNYQLKLLIFLKTFFEQCHNYTTKVMHHTEIERQNILLILK